MDYTVGERLEQISNSKPIHVHCCTSVPNFSGMNINDGGNQLSDYAKSPLLALPSTNATTLKQQLSHCSIMEDMRGNSHY
jgi:hypothetical protein